MKREPSEQTSYYCNQLKSMRTGGKLQEAYKLGKQLHERSPSDEFIESAFSWVIYDCLKRYKDEQSKYYKDTVAFLQTLRMIPSLKFDPYANDLFFENIAKYLIPGIGWDLRNTKNIPALEGLLKCIEDLDANEESRVYQTMLAYLEDPISSLGWDYRKVSDEAGLLTLLRTLSSLSTRMVSCLREPIIALGWDYRKSNNIDGLMRLLQAIATLEDGGACFKNKDTLLMFMKGFEPSKNPSDLPIVQSKKVEGLANLVEWFGLENLTRDMFEEEEYQGNKQQSLAEKIVSRYSDVLGMQDQEGRFVFEDARIRSGLNAIRIVLESKDAERWIWPQYKYGKLLMHVDGAEKARPFFAKVLLDKWNESYIWGAFADTFANEDIGAYEKCLFRGLRLSCNIGYSLALHEKALLYLKSQEKYPEAKREALIISDYRSGQGWSESGVVESQRNEAWFSVEPADDNNELYTALSAGAEEYVFPYAEKANFYVEWKDSDKNLMGIVSEGDDGQQTHSSIGFYCTNYKYVPGWAQGLRRTVIKDSDLMQSLEIGVCYSGVLSKDGKTILGGIESCNSENFEKRFTLEFEGVFDLVRYKDKQGNDKVIAFVRDTQRGSLFVPPSLFKDLTLETFDLVKGTARAVFKDDRWTMESTCIEFQAKPVPEEIEREISGEFESTRQSFGFVNGCFVPKSLVLSERLSDYDHVTVLARKSWDKKKGQWSWIAISILDKDSRG